MSNKIIPAPRTMADLNAEDAKFYADVGIPYSANEYKQIGYCGFRFYNDTFGFICLWRISFNPSCCDGCIIADSSLAREWIQKEIDREKLIGAIMSINEDRKFKQPKYKNCFECGKLLPKTLITKNSTWRPTRSNDIDNMDPEMMFCALRCAAKYGVEKAQKYDTRVK